ncbi:MAG: beta-ketoacyl synthase chain length factor [Flavobacteriales bacterium]|nr:beta-ketoacyl synthase chain length factor [Flavobacteriales bacterium]
MSSPIASDRLQFPGVDLIPKGMSRRLTAPLRSSLGCALAALDQAEITVPDGIHYGTGLGCLTDTEAFIREIDTNEGGLLSPTSFMRSTHNTVAGLLALALKATGPNLTYSQGLFSLHGALLSARLHFLEDQQARVLAGASDEYIPLLDDLANTLLPSLTKVVRPELREGAGFVVLGSVQGVIPVRITEVWTGSADLAPRVMHGPMDLVILGPHWPKGPLPHSPAGCRTIHQQELSGVHQSVPAQSLVHAVDLIRSGEVSSVWISDREQDRAGLIHVERC